MVEVEEERRGEGQVDWGEDSSGEQRYMKAKLALRRLNSPETHVVYHRAYHSFATEVQQIFDILLHCVRVRFDPRSIASSCARHVPRSLSGSVNETPPSRTPGSSAIPSKFGSLRRQEELWNSPRVRRDRWREFLEEEPTRIQEVGDRCIWKG
ncbi:hypothetical protein KM043_015451 [Ampulex compressa]|nr:hypothetical protein KM043_015451 [Ampulex compressa]